MCFDLDSSPPIPPLEGGSVDHRDLELESADGNRFAAFAALPEEPSDVGVVILPDVRGLYRFYEELALRFAERGIAAIAFDYFGRTAGVGKRGEDFDYWHHMELGKPEHVQTDLRTAADWLREQGITSVFTVGFCFGGRSSWLASAEDHGLKGAVGFYGQPARRDHPGPIDRAAEMKGPILALQAGADENITAEINDAFDKALTEAGVEHEVVTYPGAPHSFFDRKQEDFADASEDAWNRTLAFIDRYR
jgi:carboxymethylenebutenolidase